MQYLVDAIILMVAGCMLKNFSFGFMLYICTLLIFPPYVRFVWDQIYIAATDLFHLVMVASFLLNKPWSKLNFKESSFKYSKKLAIYMVFVYVSTLALIGFSSDEIPLDYQLGAFFKMLFKDTICVVCAYYALSNMKMSTLKIFWRVALIVGLYGLFVYIMKYNPYIDSLSKLYVGENRFEFFLEEARGGLQGRTSGTLDHPLSWGQMWGCILGAYFVFRHTFSNKFFLFGIPIVAILNIVLSGSRTALIAAVVILFVYLFSQGSKRIIKYTLIGVALFAVLLVAFRDNPFVVGMDGYVKSVVFFWDDSYARQAGINGSNTNMRSEQLARSIQIAENHTLCGLGYEGVSYYGSGHFSGMLGFESIVYRKIVEQGFLGLICFVLSFAYLMRWIAFLEKEKTKRILWVGYFASYFVSIVFTGIQNTWSIFLLVSFFALIRQERIGCES